MYKYITDFKIAQGDIETFEEQCRELFFEGYIWTSNFQVKEELGDFIFFQLFSKSTKVGIEDSKDPDIVKHMKPIEYILEASKDNKVWVEQTRFKKDQSSRWPNLCFDDEVVVKEALGFKMARIKDGWVYVRIVIYP